MIDLHPSTADQNITYIFFNFRFSLDMVKDDWLPSGTADQNISYNGLCSDLAWTWWKIIDLHPGTADQKCI